VITELTGMIHDSNHVESGLHGRSSTVN